jgi:hypothetical protein
MHVLIAPFVFAGLAAALYNRRIKKTLKPFDDQYQIILNSLFIIDPTTTSNEQLRDGFNNEQKIEKAAN